MLTKIDNTIKYGKQHGGFGIQILYPGLIIPDLNDTGFSTIGRIDHARITPGTLIPMHPHKDDEILTYLRSGKVKHRDSEGHSDIISNKKLMMMNAGSRFYHEEKVLEEGEVLEGLQIFIRPESENLKPQIQFYQLSETHSINQWRKIAGKDNDYPLQIRSNTWLMDMRLQKGKEMLLPELSIENVSLLFYVFNGDIQVNDTMLLNTGESVLIENENPTFTAMTRSRADIHGVVGDVTIKYYTQRVSAGLIITEAIRISEEATGSPLSPGIYTNEQIEAWKKVTKSVHDKGSAEAELEKGIAKLVSFGTLFLANPDLPKRFDS